MKKIPIIKAMALLFFGIAQAQTIPTSWYFIPTYQLSTTNYQLIVMVNNVINNFSHQVNSVFSAYIMRMTGVWEII